MRLVAQVQRRLDHAATMDDAITLAQTPTRLDASISGRQTTSSPAIIIPAIAADGTLFPVEKLAAHRVGQLHLAVSVFVFDETGALLIQQRARGKYHCGGQWANTCCSHPNWGETPADAARRRLQEELGLLTPLRARAVLDYAAEVTDGLIEHERVHVYSSRVLRAHMQVRLDPNEVAAVRWAMPDQLKTDALASPEHFAPWFRIYLQRWSELGVL